MAKTRVAAETIFRAFNGVSIDLQRKARSHSVSKHACIAYKRLVGGSEAAAGGMRECVEFHHVSGNCNMNVYVAKINGRKEGATS